MGEEELAPEVEAAVAVDARRLRRPFLEVEVEAVWVSCPGRCAPNASR